MSLPELPADDAGWSVIHQYTRAQAIEDGVLVQVDQAPEFGIMWPVAITSAAWADFVAWSEDLNARKGTAQDEDGRLADVLVMARWRLAFEAKLQAQRQPGAEQRDRLPFHVLRTPVEGRGHKARSAELCLHVGPGDQGEPVITIMLPGED